jgi:hypothetical protein
MLAFLGSFALRMGLGLPAGSAAGSDSPLAGGTAGTPIGLLLVLTKAS